MVKKIANLIRFSTNEEVPDCAIATANNIEKI